MVEQTPILIVDDERSIVDLLRTILQKEGFEHIDYAYCAEEALKLAQNKRYGLILLDIMMPGKSGTEIFPFLSLTTDGPILFISARSTDLDMLTGFALGGDDYITKPFNPLLVVARIRAHLRKQLKKPELSSSHIFDFGRFQVNEEQASLVVEGQPVHTPALVFQLLLFFCKHPNRVFNKFELYELVWGSNMLHDDNTVMVHIHRIRERIEIDPTKPKIIVNVRGLGYKLIPPVRGD